MKIHSKSSKKQYYYNVDSFLHFKENEKAILKYFKEIGKIIRESGEKG
jgi:hypothetical protein